MRYEEWSEFIDNTGIYLSEEHKKSLYPLAATKNEFQMKMLETYISLTQKKLENIKNE